MGLQCIPGETGNSRGDCDSRVDSAGLRVKGGGEGAKLVGAIERARAGPGGVTSLSPSEVS